MCIPTYKEGRYVVDTLLHLAQQTVWPRCEVVIADYDPTGERETRNAVSSLKTAEFAGKIRWINVFKSGIGAARHVACQSAAGPFIVNFDADCRFANNDAIEKLIKPLMDGKHVMVHCPNTIKPEELTHTKTIEANKMYEWRNNLINPLLPALIFEPGLTFIKDVYEQTEGFPDTVLGEGPILGWRFALKYGLDKTFFQKEVMVHVSGRRAMGCDTWLPILDLNYNNAYR